MSSEQVILLCFIAYLTVLCGYGYLGLRFAEKDSAGC